MAKKLKGLQITSTDLVDRGANPDAFIALMKRKAEDLCQGLGNSVGAVIPPTSSAPLPTDVGKAETFVEAYAEDVARQKLRELTSEMFDYCYSLSDSLSSIICDTAIDESQKADLMAKSLEQFNAVISTATSYWAKGETASPEVAHVEKEEQEEMLEKLWADYVPSFDGGAGAISAEEGSLSKESEITKQQEDEQMDFEDMTPEEKAAYEALVKKYPDLAKQETPAPAQPEPQPEPEPTAKGMSPEVAEALSEMKKGLTSKDVEIEELKKSLAMSEMSMVAKKYEVIGKKADELAEKLYQYKKAGGTIYEDTIALLDEQVNLQNQSGMFHEVGKSTAGVGGAVGKVHGAATEVAKSEQGLTTAEAIVKAFESNPDLMQEYEAGYKGGVN